MDGPARLSLIQGLGFSSVVIAVTVFLHIVSIGAIRPAYTLVAYELLTTITEVNVITKLCAEIALAFCWNV